MTGDEWLPVDGLVQIVFARFPTSVGDAESIVQAALASGKVRKQPRLAAADGWPYANLLQGGVVPLFVRYPGHYSVADFQDWLDRNPPEGKPVTSQTKPVAKSKKQAAKSRKLPAQDPIKEALKALYPPSGKPNEKLSTKILMQRIEDKLAEQGRQDVRVTRDSLSRVLGRRK
jgi:hypothetical protein